MKPFLLPLLSFFLLVGVQCSPISPSGLTSSALSQPKLPANFCYLDTLTSDVRVDLMYAGSDNFVGRPIKGYEGTRAILRRDTAQAVARAASILKKEGLGLLLRDAYRPAIAMRDFYNWSKTPDQKMKQKFYPNITKRGIYKGRYIGLTSEHTWGIAVDVTLINLATGKELDMGGRVDLLDVSSATDYPHLTNEQRTNRNKLRSVMASVGMRNYSKEWWHYFLSPPGICYVYTFPVRDNLR